MADTLNPALCVIGATPGGIAVALGAAAMGASVVLVEKGSMGVERVAAGNAPVEALVAAARRAEAIRTGSRLGIKPPKFGVEFHEVNDHVRAVAETIALNETKERLGGAGVRVIEGAARFTDEATIAVGDVEIKPQHVVLAPATRPALPPIEGLERTPYFTSDSIYALRVRPKHLIVLGATPAGLELAQAFRRLGSDVTLLDEASPLAGEDAECANIVLDALRREGVSIRANVAIARLRRFRNKIEVTLSHAGGEELVEGSELLIATPRQNDLDGLDLEAAGIAVNAGIITADHTLRTSNRRVYVVSGEPPHVAEHHAAVVLRHALLGEKVDVNAEPVPRLIFTEPELAQVGLTEAQLVYRRRPIRVLRWPLHDNVRALAERQTGGQIKAIIDEAGGILGVTIVGAAAGEQIVPWTLAIRQGLDIRAFAGIVVPYPTYSEIGKRLALGFSGLRLTTTRLRRILRRLGLG
jgi:pyruvate/2-oxoglutarate dehydrogenase complex dihydrolipoamide dehydrogenase (E3) component